MRLSVSILGLLAVFVSIADACLWLQGDVTDNGYLSILIVDNGQLRCNWEGWYTFGTEQYMRCNSGFFSWINLPAGKPNGVVAYAYNNMNFRIPVSSSRNYKNNGWSLGGGFTGDCLMSMDAQKTAWGLNGTEAVSEIASAAKKHGGFTKVRTSEDATMSKTALGFKA